MKSRGMVYLVGAGPGDPGLLTLRGAELLGRADVVVYDALVNPDLLRLARKNAEIIFGGKRSKNHAIPQGELNRLLVAKAKEGKTVVRLKGGDPYIFGRGGEEAEELVAAGIGFEVVPGVSSAVAAPNYAGVPLTHREYCSSFTVITGHEDPAKETGSVDWGPIADVAARVKLSAPTVAVIGEVVKLRPKLNWFENRSLFGRRIVVTRTREQASQLSRQLVERGAEVLEIPTIKIVPPGSTEAILEALSGLNAYDWAVFTSPNGVTWFFDFFFKKFQDMRDIGGVRIAAVGPATAAKLRELHLQVDLMPEE